MVVFVVGRESAVVVRRERRIGRGMCIFSVLFGWCTLGLFWVGGDLLWILWTGDMFWNI